MQVGRRSFLAALFVAPLVKVEPTILDARERVGTPRFLVKGGDGLDIVGDVWRYDSGDFPMPRYGVTSPDDSGRFGA